MSKNLAIIINIIIFIIPVLHDIYFKKIKYLFFPIIGVGLLFFIDNFIKNLTTEIFSGLFYGIMVVFFIYFISFISFVTLLINFLKNIVKLMKTR